MKNVIETREVEQYFFSDPERGRFFERFYREQQKRERHTRLRALKPDGKSKKRVIWN